MTTLLLLGFWAFGVTGGLFAGWLIWSDTTPDRRGHDGWPDGS